MRRMIFSAVVVLILVVSTSLPFAQEAKVQENRFFPETSFSISNDTIFNYFKARGGIPTFGPPISRSFTLFGDTVQIFQRQVIQIHNGSPTILNLLGPDFMPYTTINGAVLPGVDPSLTAAAPSVGSSNYGVAILDFVRNSAPDTFQGLPVNFGSTFFNAVQLQDAFANGEGDPGLLPGVDLEVWGAPVSKPTFDPSNQNFVYQRFQRGIMHFNNSNGTTQALLLAQYFKAIITGNGLPSDLAQAAKNSPFYLQYNNANPLGLNNPSLLPNTNMAGAFEPETTPLPPGAPTYTPTVTFTPGPATPTPFVAGPNCKFDGQMIFVPDVPQPNSVVTISVTSPTSYSSVNLVGPGSPHFLGAASGGSGRVWQWRVLITESGLFNYDFFVNATQLCVSGFFVSGGSAAATSTPTSTPTVTPTPTNTPAPAPVIGSISPPGGAPRGSAITISGNNFGPSQSAANGTVLIAGINAGNAVGGAWTNTSILIQIPSSAPTGTQPIQIIANGQASGVSNYIISGP